MAARRRSRPRGRVAAQSRPRPPVASLRRPWPPAAAHRGAQDRAAVIPKGSEGNCEHAAAARRRRHVTRRAAGADQGVAWRGAHSSSIVSISGAAAPRRGPTAAEPLRRYDAGSPPARPRDAAVLEARASRSRLQQPQVDSEAADGHCQRLHATWSLVYCSPAARPARSRKAESCRLRGWRGVFRRGPFSAVSTPIWATNASFFSVFRDLQDLQTSV